MLQDTIKVYLTLFLNVKVSPKKEVVATGSVLIPRGSLFAIDTTFTISIPDMNFCSAAVKIKERVKKDFYVRNC